MRILRFFYCFENLVLKFSTNQRVLFMLLLGTFYACVTYRWYSCLADSYPSIHIHGGQSSEHGSSHSQLRTERGMYYFLNILCRGMKRLLRLLFRFFETPKIGGKLTSWFFSNSTEYDCLINLPFDLENNLSFSAS